MMLDGNLPGLSDLLDHEVTVIGLDDGLDVRTLVPRQDREARGMRLARMRAVEIHPQGMNLTGPRHVSLATQLSRLGS
jgi:hypothetical protein